MKINRVILDLCAGTGAWSEPYEKAGYDVRRYELKAGQDIRFFKPFKERVWGVLCAPPCTHFSSAGAQYWPAKGDAALAEGLAVVDACFRVIQICQPQWWAMENPRGRLVDYLGKPALTFQPCDYGDPWTKFTCLWGRFAVPEKCPVPPSMGSKMDMVSGRKDRAAITSVTPPGFAACFFKANP